MGLFGFGKKKSEIKTELFATQDGSVIKLEDVDDGVFSEKMLGDGFAIVPHSDNVYSPVSGKVSQVFDTFHAYGITTEDGLDVLVHIGLDTVSLKGKGFKACVKEGSRIQAGDKLAEADIKYIESQGLSSKTMVVITNFDTLKEFKINYGDAQGGKTVVMTYSK